VQDIDCATIPVTLPYVQLTKNIWAELSELARTYRCHLDCAPEKPLVFAHSVYQSESENTDSCSYVFTGADIFYLRAVALSDQYRNTIRLKFNLPVALERQEIWRYEDAPVLYNEFLIPRYPFRFPTVRDIEKPGYEARYSIIDDGQKRAVLYADTIDTQTEAHNRLEYEGGSFAYSAYDVTTKHDRAYITLQNEADGDLLQAAIYGRPIVLDVNRSCFVRDTEATEQRGTCALNVTGSYFSADNVNGHTHYEDWTARELAERLRGRRELTVKTHKALFHARVGAGVRIELTGETLKGIINAFSLRYKRDAAFVAAFQIIEGGTE
jgi:hypothetical protein